MKISKEILDKFNLDEIVEREPVNIKQVEEILVFLKECSDRIVSKSKLYSVSDNAEEQLIV